MATQPNLLELAKQGDVKAIATLMNRQLQPRGITVKAALKEGCLNIMLESAQVPNQQALVSLISKSMVNLKAASIERVKVYGRQMGEEFPSWNQEFELIAQGEPIGTNSNTNSSVSIPVNSNHQIESPVIRTKAIIDNKVPNFTSTPSNLGYGVIGYNGQILLTQKRVIIFRKGRNAYTTQGIKGDKEIPISKITAVEFKRADHVTKGFLQFSILGSLESKGTVFDAVLDENTVMFTDSQQPEFEEVKRYIDSVIDDENIDFVTLKINKKATNEEIKAIFDEIQKQFEDENRKSFKRILNWIVTAVFFIIGFHFLFDEPRKMLPGLLAWMSCAVLFKPTCSLIEKQLKVKLSTNHKIAIIIATIIVLLMSIN